MFARSPTDYQRTNGRQLFNELGREADRSRFSTPIQPTSGLHTTPKSPSENRLRLGDLQASTSSATPRGTFQPDTFGKLSDVAPPAFGGGPTGGYTPGHGHRKHHDRRDEEGDSEGYLPSFILGVGSAAPQEPYAAPLEPETPWALRMEDLSGASGRGAPFGGFAPLNAYNADDDAPPQESLLDMSTSDATSLNITMSGRSLLHTRNSTTGGDVAGQNAMNASTLGRGPIKDNSVFGTPTITDDPTVAEQRNETPTAITVFGFPAAATSAVLARFRDLGDVVSYTPSSQGANYFTIIYRTRLHAQRALALNGTRIDDWMVGVVEARENDLDAFGSLNESTTAANTRANTKLHIRSGPLPRAEIARPGQAGNGPVQPVAVHTSSNGDSVYQRVMDLMFGW